MRILFAAIVCLLMCGLVQAQSKTLNNEDFGAPPKGSTGSTTSPTSGATRNSGPQPVIEDTQKSAEKRELLLHITTTDWKQAQMEVLTKFFEFQTKGNPSDFCFCNEEMASSLFSVRSWTIVESSVHEDISSYTVRVESSNKGGTPITLLWDVYIKKSKFKEYCVALMKRTQE